MSDAVTELPDALPAPSLDGLTPLHYAALLPGMEGVQICSLLLKASADPSRQATADKSFTINSSGGTNKSASGSSRGQNSSTNLTGQDYVTTEQRALLGGRTPLHLACARDYDHENATKIVQLMLDAGANPNLMCNGHTPLTLSIASGNDACVALLLRHPKTNVNQELSHGLGSALCVATSRAFEYRRDTDARIDLIKQLIGVGGASVRLRMFVPRKRNLCECMSQTTCV
ncbi:unnamed protein product [Echinostoma caproni]|uniref:Uncharacterized protein n=1 Tax=Echinostoma caproni TaxID=27848 RepID=A0A3P8L920_9TREM|nr:unnamed protein product [Echinostoma caproni]